MLGAPFPMSASANEVFDPYFAMVGRREDADPLMIFPLRRMGRPKTGDSVTALGDQDNRRGE